MPYKYPFLTIIHDLNKAANSLVLVGGWVPTVYFEYLWQEKRNFFKTKDVDFAFTTASIEEENLLHREIEKISHNKQYQRKHLQLGKEKPYQLIFNPNLPVDFLTDPTTAKKLRAMPLGQNLILNESEEYQFLLEAPLQVDCEEINIRVPQPARYIAHKIFVYLQNRINRKKDLATAYYCITRSPEPDDLLQELKNLAPTKVMKTIKKQMKDFVGSKTSAAIHDVQKSLEMIGIYEDEIDIHSTFSKLLS